MDMGIVFSLGLIVVGILLISIGLYLRKPRQPKEDEVQAQFIVTAGCLATAALFLGIASSVIGIVNGLFKLHDYLHHHAGF